MYHLKTDSKAKKNLCFFFFYVDVFELLEKDTSIKRGAMACV